MNISDLVKYRNSLQEHVDLIRLDQQLSTICNIFNTLTTQNPTVDTTQLHQFESKYRNLLTESIEYVNDFEKYINDLTNLIDSTAELQFNNEHHQSMWNNTFQNGIHDDFFVSHYLADQVKASINSYIDWHYPVLQVGCRLNGKFPRPIRQAFKTLGQRLNEPDIFVNYEDCLVGGEPFYVCDFSDDLIKRCISKFNSTFQGKICNYIINGYDFDNLPQEQFGFIFSWNFFNYASIDTIEQYLTSFIKLLRPGGVIMFSYNNCDIPASVMMTEIGRESYIPKRHLINLLKKLDLIVLNFEDIPNEEDQFNYAYASWVEVKKPGTLNSVKAHSLLGKIISKL